MRRGRDEKTGSEAKEKKAIQSSLYTDEARSKDASGEGCSFPRKRSGQSRD